MCEPGRRKHKHKLSARSFFLRLCRPGSHMAYACACVVRVKQPQVTRRRSKRQLSFLLTAFQYLDQLLVDNPARTTCRRYKTCKQSGFTLSLRASLRRRKKNRCSVTRNGQPGVRQFGWKVCLLLPATIGPDEESSTDIQGTIIS